MNDARRRPITMPGLHEAIAEVFFEMHVQLDASILDIGCGQGAWLEHLSQCGFTNLYGVDQSYLEPSTDWNFIQADLNDPTWMMSAGLAKGSFSFISAIEVIEHVINLSAFLGSLEFLLEPRGQALLTTPNVMALENRLCFLLSGKLPGFHQGGDPTHTTILTDVTLKRILDKFPNLELVSIRTWPKRAGFRLHFFGNPLLLGRLSQLFKIFLPNPYPGDTLLIELRRR